MNLAYVPDADTTPWDRWSAEFCLQEPMLPVRITESNWRLFADELQNILSISNVVPPDHRNFADWRSWGSRLKQTSPFLT